MSKKNRKRKLEGDDQSMVDWEQENIFPEEIKNEMETMWEVYIFCYKIFNLVILIIL